jgi:hypothetical protein
MWDRPISPTQLFLLANPNTDAQTDPQHPQDKAHQLIPIQKFLTSIKNDVRETCEALNGVSERSEIWPGDARGEV